MKNWNDDTLREFDKEFPPLPIPKGVIMTCICGKHNTDSVCADRDILKSFISTNFVDKRLLGEGLEGMKVNINKECRAFFPLKLQDHEKEECIKKWGIYNQCLLDVENDFLK